MKFRSAVLTGANLCLFLLFFAGSWTDVFRSLPEKAEREYQAKNYDKALGLYQEAQTRNPDSDTLAYNLGNTLYQLGRFDEAAGQFGRIVEKKNPALEPRAIYNMGNTLFQMGRQAQKNEYLQQALDSFKKSIMLDPQDEDAKYNYELTHKLIRDQQQPPQQPPPQKDGKQDQKQNQEQQSKQGEQNKDQKQKKEDQEQKQGQNQQQNQQQQQQMQQQQPQPGEMTGEEADRILDALQLMEKQMQQEEKEKKTATGRAHGPDW